MIYLFFWTIYFLSSFTGLLFLLFFLRFTFRGWFFLSLLFFPFELKFLTDLFFSLFEISKWILNVFLISISRHHVLPIGFIQRLEVHIKYLVIVRAIVCHGQGIYPTALLLIGIVIFPLFATKNLAISVAKIHFGGESGLVG